MLMPVFMLNKKRFLRNVKTFKKIFKKGVDIKS